VSVAGRSNSCYEPAYRLADDADRPGRWPEARWADVLDGTGWSVEHAAMDSGVRLACRATRAARAQHCRDRDHGGRARAAHCAHSHQLIIRRTARMCNRSDLEALAYSLSDQGPSDFPALPYSRLQVQWLYQQTVLAAAPSRRFQRILGSND
jgi:hypothetical protein